MTKEKLKFFDLKKKKPFYSNKYHLVRKKTEKGMKYFAKVIAPSGSKSTRLITGEIYRRNK